MNHWLPAAFAACVILVGIFAPRTQYSPKERLEAIKGLLVFVFVFVFCMLLLVLFSKTASAQAPWPGQSGNAVGYAAYGSLNATACGAFSSGSSWSARTTISNCTYSSYQTINCNYCEFDSVDFKGTGTTGGTLVSGSNVLFKGCRFQSNDVANYNVQTTGANIYFVLSSVTPLASFYTSPPGSTWPSAGAGANSTTITGGTNAVLGNEGYEYGINITSGGPVYVDGTDIWGFGNAIVFYSTTAQMTLVNSWMHDIADPSIESYHTDGPGYLNGSTGPTNVTIQGNTIAMLGNTNALAFQAATGGYTGLQFNSNYFSGDGKTVAPCLPGSVQCTGTFARNVIGTDILPVFGILYSTAIGSNLVWTGNTIGFRSGTTWTDSDGWTPTSGMNGQYWLYTSLSAPNSSTDQGSNTHTGQLSPSSLLWLPNAANQQTITLTAGNTGNLGSISVSLTTGTQFSQSNTCGTAISNGASCTVTVTYAPTGTGPVTDVLKITDNDPSSPEIIPLLGIDTPSSGASFTCAPSTLPAHHSGHINLPCTGSGTSWNGSTVFTLTGVSGATLISYSNSSATSETITLTTGSGTGILSVNDTTDSISTTIVIATAGLTVLPTSGGVSTTPSLSLTGTNTIWLGETPSTLFSLSGGSCSGDSLATPTIIANTSATSTLTTGSTPCTITVTDNSTTATATFTVTAGNGASLLSQGSLLRAGSVMQ